MPYVLLTEVSWTLVCNLMHSLACENGASRTMYKSGSEIEMKFNKRVPSRKVTSRVLDQTAGPSALNVSDSPSHTSLSPSCRQQET